MSYHSVSEVRGDRARISLQGWLHAPSLSETLNVHRRSLATLQQILEPQEQGLSSTHQAAEDSEELSEPSDEDLEVLSQWFSPCYLQREHLEAPQEA